MWMWWDRYEECVHIYRGNKCIGLWIVRRIDRGIMIGLPFHLEMCKRGKGVWCLEGALQDCDWWALPLCSYLIRISHVVFKILSPLPPIMSCDAESECYTAIHQGCGEWVLYCYPPGINIPAQEITLVKGPSYNKHLTRSLCNPLNQKSVMWPYESRS